MEKSDLLFRVVDELSRCQNEEYPCHVLRLFTQAGIDGQFEDMEWVQEELYRKRYVISVNGNREQFRISEEGIRYLQVERNQRGRMTQDEKMDLVLKYLYQQRGSSKWHPIETILEELGVDSGEDDVERIAEGLLNAGLVTDAKSRFGFLLKINSTGVGYCEKSVFSHSYKGGSNINIIGDVHQSNIMAGGGDISHVKQQLSPVNEADDLIRRIRETLPEVEDEEIRELIEEGLSDVEDNIKKGKEIKKYQWKALIQHSADLTTISTWIIQLVQLFDYLPES